MEFSSANCHSSDGRSLQSAGCHGACGATGQLLPLCVCGVELSPGGTWRCHASFQHPRALWGAGEVKTTVPPSTRGPRERVFLGNRKLQRLNQCWVPSEDTGSAPTQTAGQLGNPWNFIKVVLGPPQGRHIPELFCQEIGKPWQR